MSDDADNEDFRAGDGPAHGTIVRADAQLFHVRHGRLAGRVVQAYLPDRGTVSGIKSIPCGAATLAPDWEPWRGARYRPGEALVERSYIRFPAAPIGRGRQG
jgi:hypothetical protein